MISCKILQRCFVPRMSQICRGCCWWWCCRLLWQSLWRQPEGRGRLMGSAWAAAAVELLSCRLVPCNRVLLVGEMLIGYPSTSMPPCQLLGWSGSDNLDP
jgi:hypothetical protein